MADDRWFPILGSKPRVSIPWGCIAPHARQADLNHYQTLERLAERGGLSWHEALAVLTDRKWEAVKSVPQEEAQRQVVEIAGRLK